jgi:tetratricopeptide (TPR) repeat protein
MKISKILFSIIFVLFLSLYGCYSMMMQETNDPKKKLSDAKYLLELGTRPGHAEKLIKESIDIYANQKNTSMLGVAYNLYGLLELNYPNESNKIYNKAAIGNFEKSLQYFNEYFTNNPTTDNDPNYATYYLYASNSSLNLGDLLDSQKEADRICKAYDQSLQYNKLAIKIKPDAKIRLSKGFKDFDEVIKFKKLRVKCSE